MARALRVLRLVLAAATAAVCLLLCWQAADVCLTGNSPENFTASGERIEPVYSWEIVADRLAAISPALFAYLALAAAGLVLQAAAGQQSVRRGRTPPKAAPRTELGNAGTRGLRLALYAAAAVLIVLGVLNGGLRDVLVKAANICTECIGLG